MKKVLLVFIVLAMVASASASTYWIGGASGTWESTANWRLSDGTTPVAPSSGENTKMGDGTRSDYTASPVISLASAADSAKLYVYEGTLNLNSGANLVTSGGYSYVGYNNGAAGNGIAVVNINSGAILSIMESGADLRISSDDGDGTVNLNGGTLNVADKIYMGYDNAFAARLNIYSGTATIGRLYMHRNNWVGDGSNNGVTNIEGGTLIITDSSGLGETALGEYLAGYRDSGNIIGYDGAGSVEMVWEEGTGMILTAVPEPMTLSLLGLGGLALLRRRRA